MKSSQQAWFVCALMDSLINVFVPCCTAIGWLVRRCYWEGRQRGTGCWAADCLRQCLLLLCALLGDRASTSEYVRSVSVALLSWTGWHDDVPACCYVEETCEAQLSVLSSTLKRNPHATGIADVCDLFALQQPPDDVAHAASHHPVSAALQHAVNANLERFCASGPCVVTYVPWKCGKTCAPAPEWPDVVHLPREPWMVTLQTLEASFITTLSRVHRGDEVSQEVGNLCHDFLQKATRSQMEEHKTAVLRVTELSGVSSRIRASRTVIAQLSVRDRTDPPRKRRRTDRNPVSRRTIPASVDPLIASSDIAGYLGPRFVGIPLE